MDEDDEENQEAQNQRQRQSQGQQQQQQHRPPQSSSGTPIIDLTGEENVPTAEEGQQTGQNEVHAQWQAAAAQGANDGEADDAFYASLDADEIIQSQQQQSQQEQLMMNQSQQHEPQHQHQQSQQEQLTLNYSAPNTLPTNASSQSHVLQVQPSSQHQPLGGGAAPSQQQPSPSHIQPSSQHIQPSPSRAPPSANPPPSASPFRHSSHYASAQRPCFKCGGVDHWARDCTKR